MAAETRLRDLLAAIGARHRKAWQRHIEGLPAAAHRDLAPIANLPEAAWQRLKQNILAQIDQRQPARGWPQAHDLLQEARAFRYLSRLGCTGIAFSTPTMSMKSPDLVAALDTKRVLCEVKTIRLTSMAALPATFAKKLRARLGDAERQLAASDDEAALRMIYLILDHGAPLAAEINAIVRKSKPAGLQLVIDIGGEVTAIT